MRNERFSEQWPIDFLTNISPDRREAYEQAAKLSGYEIEIRDNATDSLGRHIPLMLAVYRKSTQHDWSEFFKVLNYIERFSI